MGAISEIRASDLIFQAHVNAAKMGKILSFTLSERNTADGTYRMSPVIGVRAQIQNHPGVVVVEGGELGQFIHGPALNDTLTVEIDVVADLKIMNLQPLGLRHFGDVIPGGVYKVAEIDHPCVAVFGQNRSFIGYMILSCDQIGLMVPECQALAHLGTIAVRKRS